MTYSIPWNPSCCPSTDARPPVLSLGTNFPTVNIDLTGCASAAVRKSHNYSANYRKFVVRSGLSRLQIDDQIIASLAVVPDGWAPTGTRSVEISVRKQKFT
jgi:hypothetical protein